MFTFGMFTFARPYAQHISHSNETSIHFKFTISSSVRLVIFMNESN